MERVHIDVQQLYDYSPVGQIVFRQDGAILHVNQTLQEWLEADDKEWQSKRLFPQLLSKAGQLYYHMVLQQLMTLQKGAQEISLDMVTFKGRRFPCLFNAKVIDQKCNTGLLFHAAIVKIDERKKYESELVKEKEYADELKKKLQFITNNIPVLSCTLSPEGTVEYINDRFYDYLQVKRNEYIVGTFFSRIHSEDVEDMTIKWNEALTHKTQLEKELRLRNPMNEYEWFLGRVTPYKNVEGEVVMWFGTYVNINEQKIKQEQAMQRLHYYLQDANETLTKHGETFRQIAFDQSHVIRRPLANILGFTYLLAILPMDEETKDLIDMLRQSAEELDDVIRSISIKTYETQNDYMNAIVI